MSKLETHVLSVLVDNEFGVLARVVSLFSARGYNIDSLTVSSTDEKKNISRITVITTGTPMVIEQIKSQLGRLVPVHKVVDLTEHGMHVSRELLLVKVKGKGDKRVEALADLLGLFYIAQASIVGFYFGAQAYMSRK